MNVYEQQARALKEIAAELKGIRRSLEIISKSLRQDETITAATFGEEDVEIEGEAEQRTAFTCGCTGLECTMCTPGACDHRRQGGAGNG